MTHTPNNYLRGQVLPRRWKLLTDRHLYVSLAIALVGTSLTWTLPIRDLRISEIAGLALAYSALSFGACVTGAVLALSVGGAQQRQRWATTFADGSRFSSLSELVFVFTWAAMSQLAVVVAAGLGLVLGGELVVGPEHPFKTHVVLLFTAYWIGAYALLGLVTVVGTISQLGVVDDTEARGNRDLSGHERLRGPSDIDGEAPGSEGSS